MKVKMNKDIVHAIVISLIFIGVGFSIKCASDYRRSWVIETIVLDDANVTWQRYVPSRTIATGKGVVSTPEKWYSQLEHNGEVFQIDSQSFFMDHDIGDVVSLPVQILRVKDGKLISLTYDGKDITIIED